MKKLEYKGLNRDLYYEKLESGLEIFIFPMPKYHSTFATFTTKYGSNHNNFKLKGELDYKVVPHGIAHFLEHKLFENENGVDPFTFYSQNGAHCNANTWNYRTVYLFEGMDKFNENMNYLLDFVQSPYLTDENVLKEKGIITQEAKMYLDMPDTIRDLVSKTNVFYNDYMKIDTIGTLESINNITKEDLITCYNTFYHPSNMFITIAGPVDPEETINLIKLNQSFKQFPLEKEIEFNTTLEPDNVVKDYEEVKANVTVPKASVTYKINYNKFNMDVYKLIDYLDIYLTTKFGITSDFDNDLVNAKKILGHINFDVVLAKNHLLVDIYFNSDYPDEVIKLVKEEMMLKSFDHEDFVRKQKMTLASIVASGQSVTSVVYNLIETYTTFGNLHLDYKEKVEKLNVEELEDILSKESFEHCTTTVLLPLKD
jgi:predicted Zn-dependent peptidase